MTQPTPGYEGDWDSVVHGLAKYTTTPPGSLQQGIPDPGGVVHINPGQTSWTILRHDESADDYPGWAKATMECDVCPDWFDYVYFPPTADPPCVMRHLPNGHTVRVGKPKSSPATLDAWIDDVAPPAEPLESP